jgi:hypothetical protein
MSTRYGTNWAPTPQKEPEIKPTKLATDWRDTATTCIEWLASGFIGIVGGTFVHYYQERPIWLCAGIALAGTWLLHEFLKFLRKKFN